MIIPIIMISLAMGFGIQSAYEINKGGKARERMINRLSWEIKTVDRTTKGKTDAANKDDEKNR